MPEPFPATTPVSFGPLSVLQRPHFAAHLASVSTSWAQLEATVATLLGVLTSSDARAAAAILRNVRGAQAKVEMLRDVAKAVLAEPLQDRVLKMLREFSALAKVRNRLIHGMWGLSDAHPDEMVWIDPLEQAQAPIKILLGMRAKSLPEVGELRGEMLLYTADELAAVARDTEDLNKRLSFTLMDMARAMDAA